MSAPVTRRPQHMFLSPIPFFCDLCGEYAPARTTFSRGPDGRWQHRHCPTTTRSTP
ncbi:hypothetical protein SEA_OBLADI_93 [Gordonia phage ObLaDi]|uniref:Uncharacterized protein n=2 Tax=Cafassovirus TaxID=3425056 RepID=A0A9E7QBU3_9CAUD|nr:hypothetical protein SEA_ALEEMILY_92 [Gordonia phage Aleemily]UXE03816.1 hypothetical protein SEA_OBLADI_93 [Gordonia phage ObLaDi]